MEWQREQTQMEDYTRSYLCGCCTKRDGHCKYFTFSREKQYWIFLMSGPSDSATSGSGSSRKALTNSSNLNTRTETRICRDFLITYQSWNQCHIPCYSPSPSHLAQAQSIGTPAVKIYIWVVLLMFKMWVRSKQTIYFNLCSSSTGLACW